MKRHEFRKDWRQKPRKDVNGLRTARISFRVTANEKHAIEERVRKSGKKLGDYMVCRALGRKDRVKYSDQP